MITVILIAILSLIILSLVAIYIASDKVKNIKLENSKVIITGGSEGLGLELSKSLIKKGAHVVIISRNKKKLENAQDILKPLKRENQNLTIFQGDVSDEQSIKKAINDAIDFLGGVDILINNAGITHPGRFDDVEQSHFDNIMKVDHFGHIYTIRSVLPTMKKQKHGRIIGVSSLLGLFGAMGYSTYAPAKSALIALYETLHQEYYYHNVSFSVAVPGSIQTNSYDEENKIKPIETLELEKSDPIYTPDVLASSIIKDVETWRFFISPSGFNGDFSVICCRGFAPFSFVEGVSQVYFSGIARLISMFLFNLQVRSISINVRKNE